MSKIYIKSRETFTANGTDDEYDAQYDLKYEIISAHLNKQVKEEDVDTENLYTINHVDEFELTKDIQTGDKLYILWCTHSHGSSYGHENDVGEILFPFINENVAQDALKLWQLQLDYHKSTYSVEFLNDSNKLIKLSNPGKGYHDCLVEVGIKELVVEA